MAIAFSGKVEVHMMTRFYMGPQNLWAEALLPARRRAKCIELQTLETSCQFGSKISGYTQAVDFRSTRVVKIVPSL